jgi:hypothetical protein
MSLQSELSTTQDEFSKYAHSGAKGKGKDVLETGREVP